MSLQDRKPETTAVGIINELREKVLNKIFFISFFAAGIGFGVGAIDPVKNKLWILVVLYAVLYSLIVFAHFRKTLPIFIRTLILMICLSVFGFSEIWFFGFGSLGYLFLYSSIIMGCILIGIRVSMILLAINSIGVWIVAYIYSLGILDMSSHQRQLGLHLGDWVGPFLGFFAITIVSVFFIGTFLIWLRNSVQEKLQNQQKLVSTIGDKNILLQEVHHRVKNNLQLISSLVHMTSSKKQKIEHFTRATYSRINSMALLHEQLTEGSGYSSVNLAKFFSDYINQVKKLYFDGKTRIEIKLDIPRKIQLKTNLASPLGLIFNEIITNAIVHAFKNKTGIIKIFSEQKKGIFKIVVNDNGIGLSKNYAKKGSGGFAIINALSQQIDADLEIKTGFLTNNKGTEIVLTLAT